MSEWERKLNDVMGEERVGRKGGKQLDPGILDDVWESSAAQRETESVTADNEPNRTGG